jgi:hypothetical protein
VCRARDRKDLMCINDDASPPHMATMPPMLRPSAASVGENRVVSTERFR